MRKAKIAVDLDWLHQQLDLPDDVEIIGVQSSFDPAHLAVLVQSERLTEIPAASEAPYVTNRQWL